MTFPLLTHQSLVTAVRDTDFRPIIYIYCLLDRSVAFAMECITACIVFCYVDCGLLFVLYVDAVVTRSGEHRHFVVILF